MQKGLRLITLLVSCNVITGDHRDWRKTGSNDTRLNNPVKVILCAGLYP